jgi:hypothetical protein
MPTIYSRLATNSNFVLVTILAAFGGCGSGGGADDIDPVNDTSVETVTSSLDSWDANRIGQRQQLTATAFNASGVLFPARNLRGCQTSPALQA